MNRFIHLVASRCLLMAAGAVLAVASVTQAQGPLEDNMMSDAADFDNVINLSATGDSNPVGDVGDSTGALLTQINMDTGFDFEMGNRDYFYTEVNILDLNQNGAQNTSSNPGAIFTNCEVNLLVPISMTGFADATGFIGSASNFDEDTIIRLTGGLVGTLSTIDGTANIEGGQIGSSSVINGTVNLTGAGRLRGPATINDGAIVCMTSANATVEGFNMMFMPGSTLKMTAGVVSNGSTIAGVANVTGGRFTNFTNIEGTLNISGTATVSSASTARTGAVINASGNVEFFGMDFEPGSTLNLTGNARLRNTDIQGTVNMDDSAALGFTTNVQNGGVLNINGSGVSLGNTPLDIEDGGILNQSSGNLGNNTDVESGGVANISGGTRSNGNFASRVASGGTVNLIGTAFAIGGTPVAGLMPDGMPVTITARSGTLTGTLVDGQSVSFNLSNFNAASIVTVSVPEPEVILGDVNDDGMVTFADLAPLFDLIFDPDAPFNAVNADVNEDGMITFADIAPLFDIIFGVTST